MVDYYNEMPFMVNIIDKMNEELNEEQKKIKDLKSEIEHKNDIIFDLFFNHNRWFFNCGIAFINFT